MAAALLLLVIFLLLLDVVHPQCNETRNHSGLVGGFTPTCNGSGGFAALQSSGSTGYSWCVDSDGQKIPGSEHAPGDSGEWPTEDSCAWMRLTAASHAVTTNDSSDDSQLSDSIDRLPVWVVCLLGGCLFGLISSCWRVRKWRREARDPRSQSNAEEQKELYNDASSDGDSLP